jgi:hypothetical protein
LSEEVVELDLSSAATGQVGYSIMNCGPVLLHVTVTSRGSRTLLREYISGLREDTGTCYDAGRKN